MKRAAAFTALIVLLAALLPSSASMQDAPVLTLELSGVNSLDLPQLELTVNVYDALGQPVGGLTADNFHITGPLSDFVSDVTVESVASSDLPFASVLVIDASESMAGVPLERAKEAARLFVETVRDIDPVAVMAFGSTVQLLQDYTTDKDALLAAIDSIGLLGRTALFEAANDGVNLAKESPVSRRAMILLSDGVEYGGLSTATAEAVVQNAYLGGVPSYTIGLGYGADRAFLESLSGATEARFYELPTPEELDEIYTALAQRLSSQYILSMTLDVPLDGAMYSFEIAVEQDGVTSNPISGTVRAPIPVPVVYLDSAPDEPIAEPTDIVIDIGADQELTSVMLSINGEPPTELTGPPYVISIDPMDYPPGPLTLTVTAIDADGDIGAGSATVEIAALPPQISLSRDLSEMGAMDEPIEITVNPFGQTPITEVRLSINGADFVTLEPPYTFTLDPMQLPPGDNHIDVVVVNEAGLEATYPADFIIADVPPVVSVSGLTDGQSVDAPVSFSLNSVGQTPIAEVTATINGVPLVAEDGTFTLDPMMVPPGAANLVVTATTDRGQTGQASVTLMIAPLTPIVTIEGLSDGDTVTSDTVITINAQSQTPAIHGAVLLNGVDVAHPVTLPATITLPFSAMQPGANDLAISIDTAAGPSGALSLSFIAPPTLFTPTPTATATPDTPATGTASAFAASTRTAVAQEALDASSTRTAATEAMGTQSAETQAAATQSAMTQAAATRAAVELASTVTAEALVGQTRAASTRIAATEAAQQAATAVAQAATDAPTATSIPATNTAVPASVTPRPATATSVPATETLVPATATTVTATETSSPQPTPDTSGTLAAAAALVQEAATNARSTVEAQASATHAAAQVATQAAATVSARATTDAANAQATAQAASVRATQDTANATTTAQSRATAQANAHQAATALAQELLTATAQAGRTATQQAAATTVANAGATSTAQAALSATESAVTQAAGTASARNADLTATAGAEAMAATEGAQATRTARAVLAAQTVTAEATLEVTAAAQNLPEASHTPQPTLTPVEAEFDGGRQRHIRAVGDLHRDHPAGGGGRAVDYAHKQAPVR